MNEDKFKCIDNLNKKLENVNKTVLKAFDKIETSGPKIESEIQKRVDIACVKLNDTINPMLAKERELLVKVLKQGFLASNEIISTLQPIVQANPTDLGSVISLLNKIIAVFAKPYQTAVEFVTVLTPKIATLTKNINELNELKGKMPAIPDVNINYDKLNIHMEPISITDITS